ncbi:MAG: hypothetical protein MUE58_11605 [Chitinophagaceae bacterium]|jgi:hypothetical protein|nr:hypothetical protein [Chitinophagaceae bacterium]
MSSNEQNLDAIREIRQMMDRSSRFISLSGWSGVVAGGSALAGAWLAREKIAAYFQDGYGKTEACPVCLRNDLLAIAAGVFILAFVAAVLFTYFKSRRDGIAFWGASARRLMWNTMMPMLTGALLIWRMIELEQYELVAPASLLFYGLALVNGSKFTLGEVRYLGYAMIVTGLISLWFSGYGLYFWAFGFGVLHILYGLSMWWKYERYTWLSGPRA